VGGFYKHFKSRDALVAEAVGSALGMWKPQVDAAASGGPPVAYESLVDDYLSQAHRNKKLGCQCFSERQPNPIGHVLRPRAMLYLEQTVLPRT
jgi:TetR/AcrR family transcriptional repressor of nem operon